MFKNYIRISIFLIIFSVISCKQDPEIPDHIADDPYFEDYVSPEFKWGFIDKTGELTIPAKYDAVGKFSEGLAAANLNGLWGYIDVKNKVIIPFAYKAAYTFSDEYAKVLNFEGKYQFLNNKGEVLKSVNLLQAGNFSEKMAKIEMANLWGYIDESGQIAIEPKYEKAWDFKNNYAIVTQDELYGVVNNLGEEIIKPKYNRIKDFSNGFFLAKKDSDYFYIDDSGQEMMGPFSNGTDFNHDVAYVIHNDKLQLLQKDGSLKVLFFEPILPRYLKEERWMLKNNGGYGLLDQYGQAITEFVYQQFNEFHEGVAAYMIEDLWGFIKKDGEKLSPPVFGLAWDFHDGLARAAFRDGIAYINKDISPPFIPDFKDMQDFAEGLAAVQVR